MLYLLYAVCKYLADALAWSNIRRVQQFNQHKFLNN